MMMRGEGGVKGMRMWVGFIGEMVGRGGRRSLMRSWIWRRFLKGIWEIWGNGW